MPVQRNQPSPQRQTVLTFVSPNVQDLLFFETVDAQRVGKNPPAYGTAHPDTVNFPDHTLAYVKQADPNGQFYYYYYANTRTSQDDYNFEYSQSSLGQTKFNTVVRTYISLRSSFTEDDSTVTAGSAMPTAPAAANFTGKGYVLMGRQQKRIGDRELDGIFVVEQRTYFVREDIETLKWDDLSHRNLKSTLSYYYTGETPSGAGATIDALVVDSDNAWWQTTITTDTDPDPDVSIAAYREGRQISADWFEIIHKETIAGEKEGNNIKVTEYFTTMDHTFPPVLESVNVVGFERHDGQVLAFPEYHMNPEGYRGPCKTKVTVRYSTNEFTSANGGQPEAKAMIPQSFTFGTPYVRISVPACLMNGGFVRCSTGTVDPVFKYTIYEKQLPVTNPPNLDGIVEQPDGSGGLVVRDKQEPTRGGYVRTTWTVFAPKFD
tara:strand:- start:626 stop:1927 length:1302 start_codon:yes stop_codon:yes gene_type:complete